MIQEKGNNTNEFDRNNFIHKIKNCLVSGKSNSMLRGNENANKTNYLILEEGKNKLRFYIKHNHYNGLITAQMSDNFIELRNIETNKIAIINSEIPEVSVLQIIIGLCENKTDKVNLEKNNKFRELFLKKSQSISFGMKLPIGNEVYDFLLTENNEKDIDVAIKNKNYNSVSALKEIGEEVHIYRLLNCYFVWKRSEDKVYSFLNKKEALSYFKKRVFEIINKKLNDDINRF